MERSALISVSGSLISLPKWNLPNPGALSTGNGFERGEGGGGK